MASLVQAVRDNVLYTNGYLQGRGFFLPRSFTEVYVYSVSKLASWLTLPLPLLSFLALPFFGGSSTTINLLFFYGTWSAFMLVRSPLEVEIYGTLVVRSVFFLAPALASLLFDTVIPRASRQMKARGTRHLPIMQLDRDRLLQVTGVAIGNVFLSAALQAALEYLATETLHMRSLIRVKMIAPLPWHIVMDVLKGYVVRGILQYVIHRFVLHKDGSKLRAYHLSWQHSIALPFSLIAAYDHPLNYLLLQWLPTLAPAVFFRFHVLTWYVLLALTSLEDLFLYSGYSVLPSAILLTGMARRTDAHFLAVRDTRRIGNFGRLGVIDFVCGTTCTGEDDLLDDLQTEANKHRVRERAQNAVAGAKKGLEQTRRPKEEDEQEDEQEDSQSPSDEAQEEASGLKLPRRGGRRRTKK